MSQNVRLEFCSIPVGFYAKAMSLRTSWIFHPKSVFEWDTVYPMKFEQYDSMRIPSGNRTSNERFTMTVDVWSGNKRNFVCQFTRGPKGWGLSTVLRTTLPETNSLHMFAPENWVFPKQISSSNHQFSGAFAVYFQGNLTAEAPHFATFCLSLVLLHQFGCPRSVSFTWLSLRELHRDPPAWEGLSTCSIIFLLSILGKKSQKIV